MRKRTKLLDRGINPVGFDGLHLTVTSDDSKTINADPTPKVIISASGMCVRRGVSVTT